MIQNLNIPSKDLIEDMMWMSMRYAIGRTSISCQMLPAQLSNFIHENEENLKNSLGIFINGTIREMNNIIRRCNDIVICSSNNDINYVNVILEYLKDHQLGDDEILHINGYEIRSEKTNHNTNIKIKEVLNDLRPWIDLIGSFSPTHIIISEHDGIKEENEGFLSISSFDKNVVWKSAKSYKDNPYSGLYLINEYITNIKKI